MTKDEQIEELNGRLFEKERYLLQARSEMAQAIVDKYGNEAEEYLKVEIHKGALEWASQGGKDDLSKGKPNDIQGLMDFLWEPNRREGFEFTYDNQGDHCQMKVTRCPIADIAREEGLEKWGFILHCMADEPICRGYNSKLRFKRTKTLMEGHDCCDHYYEWKDGPE